MTADPTLPMSDQDALWLTMDRPTSLMVVDGVMVLGSAPTLAQVQEVFLTAVRRFPVFACRARATRTGWEWVPDPDFDVDAHVASVVLPGEGDMAALQAFLGEQRSVPLSRERPLWQAFLVPEVLLDDGRRGAALVTRFHHAIADGVRLTQVMLSLCDGDHTAVAATVARPAGAGGVAGAAATTGELVQGAATDTVAALVGGAGLLAGAAAAVPGSAVSWAGEAVAEAARAVSDPLASLGDGLDRTRRGFGGLTRLLRQPDRWLDGLEALGAPATRASLDTASIAKIITGGSTPTVWTGSPGRSKAVAWSPAIPLDDVKRIGRHHVCTVNDVLLSAVAGGLRRYLADHDTAVDEVIWMVPVNLKPHAGLLPAALGNHFALVFLPMALDDVEHDVRLRHMHTRMTRIKNSDEAAITFGLQRVVSRSPGPMATGLTTFFADKAIGVLTNVPGPRHGLTLAGAPVEQVVGFAPCSGDQPMTATIFSYDGTVTVGFATDAGLVPDPERLAALVCDEVMSMLEGLDG